MRASHLKTGTFIAVCLFASTLFTSAQTPQASDAESLTSLRERADHGNADAQLALGKIYRDGKQAPQDFKEAAVWFRKAADRGNAEAQEILARLYYNGHGVPKDASEAAGWVRKAADQGYAPAQVDLGSLYNEGAGVPRDLGEAARWFRKAAIRGTQQRSLIWGTSTSMVRAYPRIWAKRPAGGAKLPIRARPRPRKNSP